jgi:hypothetical protein
MKTLENQVATMKQSMIISALGIIHKNPACWWKCYSKNPNDKRNRFLSFGKEGYYKLCFPAFTGYDLDLILPESIETDSGPSELIWYKKDGVFWCEHFIDGNELKKYHGKSSVRLKAYVLISLIKNGYFDPLDNKIIDIEKDSDEIGF